MWESLLILALLLPGGETAPQKPKHPWAAPWPEPEAVETLYREFTDFVSTPGAYEKRIRRDAAGYPEGAIRSLALPTYGFANYALAHPESAEECQRSIERPWFGGASGGCRALP